MTFDSINDLTQFLSVSLSKDKRKNCFVYENEIITILSSMLELTKNSKFEVYFQANPFFTGKLISNEVDNIKVNSEQMFLDFDNFFNKNQFSLIRYLIKRLYNYSKNRELSLFVDYPKDIYMILVIENFNLYDKNSQLILSKLIESHSNIFPVLQLRDDFDFAIKNIDKSAINR